MDDRNELKAPHKQLIEQMMVHYDLPSSRTPPVSFDNQKIVSPKTPPETETPFPEGGLRAWSVVAGAAFVSFATSFWVFQSYYEQNILENESASNISWIGSMQYGLLRLPSFFTGWLFDRGYYNCPFAIGSVLYVLALFLVAECKTYWQFALCQGLATGTLAGMLFGATPAVVSHWFHKKRSFALGVSAVGSSIGGTILPIATQQLLNRFGFRWSMRIMASILGFAVLISNLLLRPRLPPSTMKHGMFNFAAFKNPAYSICVLAYNITLLGLFVPLSYLNLSAQVASGGRFPTFTFYLISITNCASVMGRVSSGYLADRFGALNVLIPFTFMAGVTSYAWPYAAANMGCIIFISIIYGWATGAFVSLLPSAPIRMGEMGDAGSRVGMVTSCISFGSVGGLPLAGLVLDRSGGFVDVGLYAGSVIMLGCVLLMVTRRLALGQWLGKF